MDLRRSRGWRSCAASGVRRLRRTRWGDQHRLRRPRCYSEPGRELFGVTFCAPFGRGQSHFRRTKIGTSPASDENWDSPLTAMLNDNHLATTRPWRPLAVAARMPFVVVISARRNAAAGRLRRARVPSAGTKEFFQARSDHVPAAQRLRQHADGAEMLAWRRWLIERDWWLARWPERRSSQRAPLTALGTIRRGPAVPRTLGRRRSGIGLHLDSVDRAGAINGLVEGVGAFYLFTALVAVWMWAQRQESFPHEMRALGRSRQKAALPGKPAVAHDETITRPDIPFAAQHRLVSCCSAGSWAVRPSPRNTRRWFSACCPLRRMSLIGRCHWVDWCRSGTGDWRRP